MESSKESSQDVIDINSLPITKAINLSHLCGRINSESTKHKKLKKKMKKRKTTTKEEEIEENEESKKLKKTMSPKKLKE